MKALDYGGFLRSLHEVGPTAVPDSLTALAQRAGAVDVVVYLIDFSRTILLPVPARGVHVELPEGEEVGETLSGQAFTELRLVSEPQQDGTRVWVPILEGSDCTGVLALTLHGDLDDDVRSRCEELGMLAGWAISLAARTTDLYNLVRRRRAMSLAAGRQWDLLPPLRLHTPEVDSSAVLEPAYDVGGDSFDHNVNSFSLDVAIMDAMGHGLESSMTSSLAIGSYRHDRREGQALPVIHERLDGVLARTYAGERFVTGQLARLDLRSGELTWINAGHPAPFLIRDGRVAGSLKCRPSLPWGLGDGVEQQATEGLQPGDSVLFHTDGVTEGRSPGGDPFGVDRLVGLVERAAEADAPTSAVLDRLVREVLTYQDHRLRDDATMLWVTWRGPR